MKNKTTKVRAAVVGLGWPGMQHLKGYTIDPRSEVIAVCDLDEKRTQEVAKEHDIPNTYTNHLEMLENKDIDLIFLILVLNLIIINRNKVYRHENAFLLCRFCLTFIA